MKKMKKKSIKSIESWNSKGAEILRKKIGKIFSDIYKAVFGHITL